MKVAKNTVVDKVVEKLLYRTGRCTSALKFNKLRNLAPVRPPPSTQPIAPNNSGEDATVADRRIFVFGSAQFERRGSWHVWVERKIIFRLRSLGYEVRKIQSHQ
jgi:hypothetical protein